MKIKYDKSDIEKVEYLTEHGLQFSHNLRDGMDYYFRRLTPECSYFSVALAISLTWTKHAKPTDEFIDYAARFIDARITKDENIIERNIFRFGYDTLDMALTSYRMYLRRIRPQLVDFDTCSLDELTKLQHNLLNRLNILKQAREIVGIGCWLFLGPFKIILGHQERLWAAPNVNDVVMATGIEVERGLNRLSREAHAFMQGFDRNWLEQGDNSLLESYGTCIILHDRMKLIADIANTPAIHINSALYLYGKEEI